MSCHKRSGAKCAELPHVFPQCETPVCARDERRKAFSQKPLCGVTSTRYWCNERGWGAVWMINCHQAPAISNAADAHDSIKPLNLDTSLKTFLFFHLRLFQSYFLWKRWLVGFIHTDGSSNHTWTFCINMHCAFLAWLYLFKRFKVLRSKRTWFYVQTEFLWLLIVAVTVYAPYDSRDMDLDGSCCGALQSVVVQFDLLGLLDLILDFSKHAASMHTFLWVVLYLWTIRYFLRMHLHLRV